MKYMGSKSRIVKFLLPIILKDRKPGQWYVEPFCGGCNVLQEVQNPRLGADQHKYLMAYLNAYKTGYLPPRIISKDQHVEIMRNRDLDPILAGYAGFALTFATDWDCGYVSYETQDRGHRTHKDITGFNDAVKHQGKLKGARLLCSDYRDVPIPTASIIYCDPPYAGTTGYGGKFNHIEFWQWCRDKSLEGHKVFISEYNAPTDFECVWAKEQGNHVRRGLPRKIIIEKLFTYNRSILP